MNLNAHHPILDIQENVVFASNGNVACCYKVGLPEIYSLSETDFEALHGMWFQGLKSLPTGTVVHKQDWYRQASYDTACMPSTFFLQKATRDYFQGRSHLAHQSYLFFVLPLSHNPGRMVNPFRKQEKAIYRKLDHQVSGFREAVHDSVAFINNSGRIRLEALDGTAILQLGQSYFNGFQTEVDTDLVLDRNGIRAGEGWLELLAITNEKCFGGTVQTSKVNPRFTSDSFTFHQGFVDGLGLDLSADHMVNHIVFMDDRHRWRKILDKRVEELKKSIRFGSQNAVVLKKVQQVLDNLNSDEGLRMVRGHFNVLVWDRDPQSLQMACSKIKAVCKELDITPYIPKGENRKHYYLNSFFAHAPNLSGEDCYVTDLKHALCLWPNVTNYHSDAEGVLFNDRQFNIPVKKDVWDTDKKRIKARNFAIFAPTGEGKSFLANNILRQYFEEGVRLVIIDLGGSYTKFATLYPQDHVVLRYEEGKNLGINPFYIQGEADLTPERLEDLMVFLRELMHGDEPPSKRKEVALKKVLLHYYSKVRSGHSLTSLYKFVAERKDRILEVLGLLEEDFSPYVFLHILSEYVEGGLYGFLFNSGGDGSFKIEDKRLIIFELDEVRDNKEVLSVMLKLIKTAVQRTIWSNRSERGVILFDEFAKQLKFNNVLESVEFYYQAIRKQNGAIGIILQSINQLPDNGTAASILENTQVIYSLRNQKGYDDLAKRLKLSAHDVNQLRSLQNSFSGKQKYTEIFLKIGKESNVFRLEVPPEAYAAYLTDGTENALIMQLHKELGCMEKAIKAFVKQHLKQK
ncbi:TraG family conjugative transposon ATPase [Galbibacter sp. BG1]|uniref:TraG family conjugative transposon ATPase n=1 Tax=Galbibacter sp. BG1 TaxID=1170699 RepID=UPI0015BF68CA|nr:TraG family conjugative transposon ATPase [Galbibacter sp. BG1]QLE02006.1 TraG family conjugative transposon ATPase [Galbibacter sp. BG1]